MNFKQIGMAHAAGVGPMQMAQSGFNLANQAVSAYQEYQAKQQQIDINAPKAEAARRKAEMDAMPMTAEEVMAQSQKMQMMKAHHPAAADAMLQAMAKLVPESPTRGDWEAAAEQVGTNFKTLKDDVLGAAAGGIVYDQNQLNKQLANLLAKDPQSPKIKELEQKIAQKTGQLKELAVMGDQLGKLYRDQQSAKLKAALQEQRSQDNLHYLSKRTAAQSGLQNERAGLDLRNAKFKFGMAQAGGGKGSSKPMSMGDKVKRLNTNLRFLGIPKDDPNPMRAVFQKSQFGTPAEQKAASEVIDAYKAINQSQSGGPQGQGGGPGGWKAYQLKVK